MSRTVTFEDVLAARERVKSHIVQTPFRESVLLGKLCGRRVFCKFENQQITGSFKERGALNKLAQLTPEEARAGVIAASAGNHAQAVAYHGRNLGIPTTIVMPVNTPIIKVNRTESLGARVILHGSIFDEANALALKLADEEGYTFVSAFDDPAVIAGQGTLGLELLAEGAPEFDTLLVPVGGGGLIAGVALAVKHLRPDVHIVGVQTDLVPGMVHALEKGIGAAPPVRDEKHLTIADGIAVQQVCRLTLDIVRRYVDQLITVSESQIAHAVQQLLEIEKTVVEGAGAVGLAALMHHGSKIPGERCALILSGGNIDIGMLAKIIDKGLVEDGRLAQITVQLPDVPGALAGATAHISACGANLREVTHHRSFNNIPIGQVRVTFTVETRSRAHVDQIVRALGDHGCVLISS